MAPNKRREGMVHLNLWVPGELDEALLAEAGRLGLSRTDAIVLAVQMWLPGNAKNGPPSPK